MKWNIRQVIALLLAGACLLGLILPVLATEVPEETEETTPVREPGQCGESMYWDYGSGTLTITGSGAMDDYAEGEAPWDGDKLLIKTVVIGDGITYIGASAFENYDQLTQVQLGKDVREIGKAAFKSCDGLKEIRLPKSFRVFGEESFRSCALMKKMYFEGGMPSFRLNCLWDTTAKLIYPANNPWPLEHIIQLEEAFQTRIEFLSSDGTDPYVTEWDLHEATAPTEETEPEETVPPTTAETVSPTTEATIPPTTEAATVPVVTEPEVTVPAATEAPETTQAPTAPVTEAPTEPAPKDEGPDSGIGFALIMMVLSLFAIGALVFGRSRSKGKYRY